MLRKIKCNLRRPFPRQLPNDSAKGWVETVPQSAHSSHDMSDLWRLTHVYWPAIILKCEERHLTKRERAITLYLRYDNEGFVRLPGSVRWNDEVIRKFPLLVADASWHRIRPPKSSIPEGPSAVPSRRTDHEGAGVPNRTSCRQLLEHIIRTTITCVLGWRRAGARKAPVTAGGTSLPLRKYAVDILMKDAVEATVWLKGLRRREPRGDPAQVLELMRKMSKATSIEGTSVTKKRQRPAASAVELLHGHPHGKEAE